MPFISFSANLVMSSVQVLHCSWSYNEYMPACHGADLVIFDNSLCLSDMLAWQISYNKCEMLICKQWLAIYCHAIIANLPSYCHAAAMAFSSHCHLLLSQNLYYSNQLEKLVYLSTNLRPCQKKISRIFSCLSRYCKYSIDNEGFEKCLRSTRSFLNLTTIPSFIKFWIY